MQMKLELVPIPVSDVDRAIEFYEEKLGFTKDFDVRPHDGVRVVQRTPQGSGCSFGFGEGLDAYAGAPGTIRALHLIVADLIVPHVPSSSAGGSRSARSMTSVAGSEEQALPTPTATPSSCRRWPGARARNY